MNRRRLLVGGLGVALVGAVVVGDGLLAERVPVEWLVGVAGNDYLLVAALGGLALLVGVVVLERSNSVTQARMPDAEGTVSAPAPGDGFDDAVGGWRHALPVVGRERRRAVRERLRATAVDAVRRREGCTREAARELVETGAWTDDDVAAGFLGGGAAPAAPGGWLRALRRRRTRFAVRARRTADVIAALATGDRSGGARR